MPQGSSSFQAYGFGASPPSGGGRAAAVREAATPGSTASNMSRRGSGSRVNVNITPTTAPDTSTPEIRRYTKRLGSDILCGSLWGEWITVGGVDYCRFLFNQLLVFSSNSLRHVSRDCSGFFFRCLDALSLIQLVIY